MFEYTTPDIDPHPETLASRTGVESRRKTREVSPEAFASVENRIDGGLTWGVGAIATDDSERLLLVREDGEWVAPGGEVEDGESHEQALVREVREETGVEIVVDDLVAVTEVSFTAGSRQATFSFANDTATPETTKLTSNPGLHDEEIESVEWVETLPAGTLDREVLADYY